MGKTDDHTDFLASQDLAFVTQLYADFLQNPQSVDPSWQEVFQELGDDAASLLGDLQGVTWPRQEAQVGGDQQNTLDSIRALMLIRSYRVRGHLRANLDPLGLVKINPHPELDPQSYGFLESDYDRPIFINGYLGLETATLREICDVLKKTYGESIGVEYMHIQDPAQKSWIQERIEDLEQRKHFTPDEKKEVLKHLIHADTFEQFLHTKYPGAKRFGIEGAESTIVALQQIIMRGSQLGVQDVVLGMAHRGRLNVLANIIGKPVNVIFSEFQGAVASPEEVQGSGDVKYHLGCSGDREYGGKTLHLSLTPNPSHLEAVNPVVVGKVRAKQRMRNDTGRDEVVGLLIHGDAAIAGQGLVAETLSLSELAGYRTGGTIHLVINNQIGFTTSPKHSRSSPYCSDVAKMIQAPIFHVNGDDPEAVTYIARLAMEFRQQFKKDVVIDMFCYRRHGHNEMDEPAFTQPAMYKAIRAQSTTVTIYKDSLIAAGVLSDSDAQAVKKAYEDNLQREFEGTDSTHHEKLNWLDKSWKGIEVAVKGNHEGVTEVATEQLHRIAKALTSTPDGFVLHPRLKRLLEDKQQKLTSGENIDWATAEALALGSLLCEGHVVRLSGQDSGRGTFSQRHGIFVDQETEEKYVPLNHIQSSQAKINIIDSPLSEASVLGFEYGYTLADPYSLVIWEAQFGDFANGAQVMFDQFICSGEAKWLRMSGLVMLLPHGYEGQGPEHSSGRLERYLQLCAENNWQVVNCSTPASYFHVLRRQLRRKIRKPLVVMTPKSLLRHRVAVSSFADMGPGSQFLPVIPEHEKLGKVKRVVLCSGKIYYDLLAERQQQKITDVAIIRMEQFYPFPKQELAKALAGYKDAEVVWCQEEPRNMGGWTFVDRRLEAVLRDTKFKDPRPQYDGRKPSASTATGYMKRHQEIQKQIVARAVDTDKSIDQSLTVD